MLPNWYNEYKKFIENSIMDYLKNYLDNKTSSALENFKWIIFYSVLWWKRIRSILALEFFLIFSKKKFKQIKQNDDIIKFCIALEIIHSYSLIHDDMPCIDNDSYRRWELTVWKKYWENNALLVWDLLNSIAFEILSEIKDPILAKELTNLVSRSVWFYWALGWQVEDTYFEKNIEELDRNILKKLHNKKTWALIKASILWWIILWWKTKNLDDYEKFAKNIWLAFQIKDDILDVEWTKEETGKSVWWEKKWFVYFLWIKKSKKELDKIIEESLDLIKAIKSEKLNFITNYIKDRKK